MTVNATAALVNISQVVTTIVVVAANTTPTETTVGTAVMLITLTRDSLVLVLVLAHALVAAINFQVALEVDHAVPEVDALKAQATTAVAATTTPITPIICMK